MSFRLLPFLFLLSAPALADPPVSSYIFPAGAQRGSKVTCRVGGLYLASECGFGMVGAGIEAPQRIQSMSTLVLVGPYHHNPIAQQGWDYPKDMRAEIKVAQDAPLGLRHWYCSTAEGVTQLRPFVVGDLPEATEEEEKTAQSQPQQVPLPVTVNGRIYPRADLDEYSFEAAQGQHISCEVMAERLGSKLDPKLELRDASGKLLAENDDHFGRDSLLLFTIPSPGKYVLRIHDIAFEGDQDYVYRLSLRAGPYITHVFPAGGRSGTAGTARFYGMGLGSEGFLDQEVRLPQSRAQATDEDLPRGWHLGFQFEVGDEPEVLEKEPNDDGQHAQAFSPPAILNGQILKPGDVDDFTLRVRQGERLDFGLSGKRLGSPITPLWSLRDSTGKEIFRQEGDGQAAFQAPADGDFTLRVQECHPSLGGSDYIYRLAVRSPKPDVRLNLERDAVAVEAGQTAKVKLSVSRLGGFAGEIQLAATSLPPGITMTPSVVQAGENQVELSFTASKDAPFGMAQRVVIVGVATRGGERFLRAATVPLASGPKDSPVDGLAIMVAYPPPFNIASEEVYDVAHRGATFVQKYRIERKAGFQGEVVLSLADRQTRYLQGATAPPVVVKPEATEASYPVFFPEVMDLNRTARVLLMGTAKVTDAFGKVWCVTHATQKQLIVRVTPALLALPSDMSYVEASRGQALQVPLHVSCAPEFKEAVTVEALFPPGMRGITAPPVTVPPGQEDAVLSFQVDAKAEIVGREHVTLRATALQNGYPVVSEKPVEIELK